MTHKILRDGRGGHGAGGWSRHNRAGTRGEARRRRVLKRQTNRAERRLAKSETTFF